MKKSQPLPAVPLKRIPEDASDYQTTVSVVTGDSSFMEFTSSSDTDLLPRKIEKIHSREICDPSFMKFTSSGDTDLLPRKIEKIHSREICDPSFMEFTSSGDTDLLPREIEKIQSSEICDPSFADDLTIVADDNSGEDASGTSKAQPFNFLTLSNEKYEKASRVSTALIEERSLANTQNQSTHFQGTSSLDIKCPEFDNALMESCKLLLEQFLQLIPLHMGRVMDSQGIRPYGRAIVDKSSGLPFVIKVAERTLPMDHSMIAASLREVRGLLSTKTLHEVLKFGYDRLEKHDIKSCFLYSALFTASEAVSVAALIDSMIDEGFITGCMIHARKRGHDIIKHLIDVSFLQSTDDGLMVKVHDLICDMALEILSEVEGSRMLLSRYLVYSRISYDDLKCSERPKPSPSGHLWILKAGEGLIEPPPEKEWEEAKMVLLMDNKLSSLPERPRCSKLLTLFLQRNPCLRAIPSNFFETLSSLQILNLSRTRIKCLPQSFSKIGCLQVLILRNCDRLFYLPSEIGDLKHLLVLDIHGTEICQLPNEISKLFRLVHLQVRFYGTMDQDEMTMLPSQLISKGSISKLSRLRELSIIVFPGDPRWTDIASDITTEVTNLTLSFLSFHFPEIYHLEQFINLSPAWRLKTLSRFNFIVGHDVKRLVSHVSDELERDYNQQDRCFRFVDGKDIPNTFDAIGQVLHQSTAFYLDHHLAAHFLTQFGLAAINDLKFCIVRDCPKLEAIIYSHNFRGRCFPFLEVLSIHYSWNLRQIWVGQIRAGSLSMLRRLSVHCCPKLEFILSPSMVAVLFGLEELTIEDCQSLKYVIGKEEQVSDDTGDYYSTTAVADFALDQMEVKLPYLKVLKLHYLPKLESIWNGGGDLPCLKNISVYNCPRLNNLNFKSQIEVTIKKIKVETTWWNDLKWDDSALPDKLQHCVEEINGDDIWDTV